MAATNMNDQAFQMYKRKAEKTWNRIFLPFENGVAAKKRTELKTKQENLGQFPGTEVAAFAKLYTVRSFLGCILEK